MSPFGVRKVSGSLLLEMEWHAKSEMLIMDKKSLYFISVIMVVNKSKDFTLKKQEKEKYSRKIIKYCL